MILFIEKTDPGQTVWIREDDLRHLFALRPDIGDTLRLSDGTDHTYTGKIEKITKKEIAVQIETKEKIQRPAQKIRLFTALLKGDKNEFVIQKATELGADEILFFASRHCVAKAEGKEQAKKVRFEKTAKLAAMQCGADTIPVIGDLITFNKMKQQLQPESTAFFYEKATLLSSQFLPRLKTAPQITLITGPEGGFSPEEAEQLQAKGIPPLSLGKRILRAETAPICAMAVLLSSLGRM